MNSADASGPYRDLFNRSTLELTFKTLRRRRPALALQIQNALVDAYPRDDYHTALTAAELPLGAATASEIAQELAALGDELLADSKHRTELTLVRSLMLDWLMLVHEREQPAA